jgi:hypothetical protein
MKKSDKKASGVVRSADSPEGMIVKLGDNPDINGKFGVMFRNGTKQLAQLEKMDQGRLIYMILTGPDTGQKLSATVDKTQFVKIWNKMEDAAAAVLTEKR